MARSLRVEYAGARYHIMCRGNQSRQIFKRDEDADLFVRTLGEVCVRNQVVVHAWCLMGNHYHLLLETPQGNLVSAMKWFQGTFTQRYNARHQLWGHLFQGRYKAKVIDDDDGHYFRTVGDYIHLNPADAGLVGQGHLSDWPWSSYPLYLLPPSKRPAWLRVSDTLSACGIAKDSIAGRRAYGAYMDLRQQTVTMHKKRSPEALEWERMERGWVHGSKVFRERMLECIQESDPSALRHVDDADQKRDLGEAAARAMLDRCLEYFKLVPDELHRLPKSDPRKMLIAGLLRYHFPVSASWISQALSMGHYTTVSRAMRFFDKPDGEWRRDKKRILKFTG